MWNPKYDVAYHAVLVMGRHLELMDESGKNCNVKALLHILNYILKWI